MRVIRYLFSPRSIDAFIVVICLLLLTNGVYLFSIYQWPDEVPDFLMNFSIGSVTVTAAGIAVAAGWNRHSWLRAILLSLVCVLLLLTPIVLPHFFPSLPVNKVAPGHAVCVFDCNFSKTGFWALGLIPVLATLLSLVVVGLRKSPIVWRLLVQKYKLTRKKSLMVVAGVLAAFAIAKNFLRLAGFDSGEEYWSETLKVIFVSGVYTLSFLLAVHWPGWAVTVSRRWSWPLIVVWLAVFATIGVAAWVIVSNIGWISEYEIISGLTLVAGAFLFLLTLVAMRSDQKRLGETAGRAAPIRTGLPTFRGWPSIWSVIPSSLLLAIAAVPWCFDLTLFAQSRGGLVQMDWSLAWESARLRRLSGGQIRVQTMFRTDFVVVELGDPVDPKVLSALGKTKLRTFLMANLAPSIDTRPLRGRIETAIIINSRLSRSQLADICDRAREVTFDNVDVNPSSDRFSSAPADTLVFWNCPPGQPGRILDAFDEPAANHSIDVRTELAVEDWPALLSASQSCPVSISGPIAGNVLELVPTQSCDRIRLVIPWDYDEKDFRSLIASPLVSNSNIRLVCQGGTLKSFGLNIDMHFLLNDRIEIQFYPYERMTGSFDRSCHDCNLAFEVDPDDQIIGLYLPNGDRCTNVAVMSALRTLSFDAGWINPETKPILVNVTDVSHLAGLTQLERLDFSVNFNPRDLGFLASLTSLKHLQIPAVDRTVTGPPGFDSCPSLESVILFGKPDALSAAELASLPNLKSLTIVNSNDDEALARQDFLANLRLQFNGINVEVLPTRDFQRKPLQSFMDHVKRTREKLAEEYWGKK